MPDKSNKISQTLSKTGLAGLLAVFLIGLFIFSGISDLMYGLTTASSEAIKVVLLIGIGITSFFALSKKHLPQSKFKKQYIKEPLAVQVQANVIQTPKQVVAQIVPVIKQNIVTAHSTEPIVKEKIVEIQEEIKPVVVLENRSVLQELRNIMVEKGSQDRSAKQKEFFEAKGDINLGVNTYLGVNIIDVVKLSEEYCNKLRVSEIQELMKSSVHDERIVGVWLLVNRYKKADESNKQTLYSFYLENRDVIQNWDMIDVASRNIIGEHLKNKIQERHIVDVLIASDSLWDKRTAVMSSHPSVISGDLGYGFSVVERLLDCDEELVQSAIGWVLKEAYKQNSDSAESFIKSHFHSLSKQAIRIGTERMEKTYRKAFLRGEFEKVPA